MNRLVLAMIFLYRKFVSPFKGFSCAYRLHTGGLSCSTHGYRVIERHGISCGLKLIGRRLDRCRQKYLQFNTVNKSQKTPSLYRRRQEGFCDLDCDVGDLGYCACDVLGGYDSSPCNFDFSYWRKRKKSVQKDGEVKSNVRLKY